jgi:superfamily I DNA/RNA helicase
MAFEYQRHFLADEATQEEAFSELEVADYLVFLLAFDTYFRWLKETGQKADALFMRGGMLAKMMERDHLDKVRSVIEAGVKSPGALKMLEASMKYPTSAKGCSMRALKLRTVLTRGGPSSLKHVFGTSIRARKEVSDAIEASTSGASAEALVKFSTISLKNKRLQGWIGHAADAAGKPVVAVNPVHEAVKQVGEDAQNLLDQKVTQEGAVASSEVHAEAQAAQANTLARIENHATDAAKAALDMVKAPDRPVTRSEATGIATAVATAIATDPDSPAMKAALTVGGYPLDEEQRAAALTDGKVLVAAGAGAGKSTTLVGRLKYLIQVKHESPSRILVATFNTRAAEDLRASIGKELGSAGDSVTCGTMHSVFRNFIGTNGKKGFGNDAERAALSDGSLIATPRGKKNEDEGEEGFVIDETGERVGDRGKKKAPTPRQMTAAVRAVIRDIGPGGLAAMTGLPEKLFGGAPPAKLCNQLKENWLGNDVDFETALKGAETVEEVYGAVWMEVYAGLKGDRGPDWKPPRPSAAFQKFMRDFRADGRRLADLNDMLLIFRDILERDPAARKAANQMFDHVLVDEAQDLNVVQHDIFRMMTDQVQPGSGKSFWIVGDDKQAIYQFRGARPGLFSALDGKEGWVTRKIQTNYRCDPEIVEAANKVTAHNTGQIEMQARPDPKKPRGRASIVVETPPSYVGIAGDIIESFEKTKAVEGSTWAKGFAVLSRTNNELNAFEDQCIIHEIPYRRSKGKGFLESTESNAVLGYMDLALSSDNEELTEALVHTVNAPNREIFLGDEAIERIVKDSLKGIAQAEGVDVRSFNPLDCLTRPQIAKKLAADLKEPYRAAKIAAARKLERERGGWFADQIRYKGEDWMWWEDVDKLTDKLLEMGRQVMDLRTQMRSNVKTEDLLNRILDGITTEVGYYNKKTQQDTRKTVSLKQSIKESIAFNRNPDDDEPAPDSEKKVTIDEHGTHLTDPNAPPGEGAPASEKPDPLAGLGTVRYLFDIARPNSKDQALGVNPGEATGFYRKLDRYKTESRKLQDKNLNPDQLSLSTVHSVKGAQWDHVALCCSYGFFPGKKKDDSTLLETELQKLGARIPWPPDEREYAVKRAHTHIEDRMISERNLAYVGITRAKTDLQVICSQERVKRKPGDPPTLGVFVREAGLAPGQNVHPESTPEAVKVAFEVSAVDLDEIIGRYGDVEMSYDRRAR